MSGLVRQVHKYDSRSIRYFLRNEKPFLHRELILVMALGFHVWDWHGSARLVLDEVDTLNYVGMSDVPPVPTPIPLQTVFAKILFAKSNLPLIREI